MYTKEGIREQFLSMGVRINDVALSKCLELCNTYNLSEDELLETWMAYAVSNVGDADPTLDMLNQMERKELAKSVGTCASTSSQSSAKKSSLTVYNASLQENSNHNDILQLYSTPTAKRKEALPKENTPDGSAVKKLVPQGRSPRAVFSPASFSPKVATPSTKYESRTNSGDIVLEFGDCEGASWLTQTKFTPTITHDEVKCQKFRYMFERLQDKAEILDEIIHELGQELLLQNDLPEPTNPTVRHAELFVAIGRVCCDANGRLNPTSVLLESEQSFGCGKSIALDLSLLETYSLFPGQIIAIEGVNLDGKKVVVKKLYTDITPVLTDSLPTFSKDGPLQVVVAAGPYTQTDTLMYQPLEDLVSYIRNHEPHALILVGPFVDAKHPHVEEGKLAETHDALFEKILEGIMEPLKGSHTQVIVVPCWRDVHHHVVYPTPPFLRTKKLMHTNLHLMCDPCQFSICGVKFGVTSVDVLFHLGKEEISYPAQGSDRLGRLAGHIVSQRNFYPLFPPAEELSVDMGHWEKLSQLPVAPHILILPSDLRYFIKNIKGCLVVNPERLAKGLVGGSMARLEIKVAEQGSQFPISVTAQILKI